MNEYWFREPASLVYKKIWEKQYTASRDVDANKLGLQELIKGLLTTATNAHVTLISIPLVEFTCTELLPVILFYSGLMNIHADSFEMLISNFWIKNYI